MGDLAKTLAEIKALLDALTRSDLFKKTKHCHTGIYSSLVNGFNYIFSVLEGKVELEEGIVIYFLHKLKTAKQYFEVKA